VGTRSFFQEAIFALRSSLFFFTMVHSAPLLLLAFSKFALRYFAPKKFAVRSLGSLKRKLKKVSQPLLSQKILFGNRSYGVSKNLYFCADFKNVAYSCLKKCFTYFFPKNLFFFPKNLFFWENTLKQFF
jgi:hypothetical protein